MTVKKYETHEPVGKLPSVVQGRVKITFDVQDEGKKMKGTKVVESNVQSRTQYIPVMESRLHSALSFRERMALVDEKFWQDIVRPLETQLERVEGKKKVRQVKEKVPQVIESQVIETKGAVEGTVEKTVAEAHVEPILLLAETINRSQHQVQVYYSPLARRKDSVDLWFLTKGPDSIPHWEACIQDVPMTDTQSLLRTVTKVVLGVLEMEASVPGTGGNTITLPMVWIARRIGGTLTKDRAWSGDFLRLFSRADRVHAVSNVSTRGIASEKPLVHAQKPCPNEKPRIHPQKPCQKRPRRKYLHLKVQNQPESSRVGSKVVSLECNNDLISCARGW
mmetsp:Transcript_19155/g.31884  ORF Transcript_19155/g.31884 Transcript_19155/m.31884 type:complete len:335 (+) Transcript_19155:330-1334(+)